MYSYNDVLSEMYRFGDMEQLINTVMPILSCCDFFVDKIIEVLIAKVNCDKTFDCKANKPWSATYKSDKQIQYYRLKMISF